LAVNTDREDPRPHISASQPRRVAPGSNPHPASKRRAGNLIGSSTYNIGLVLGGSALVAPLAVTPELAHVDLPIMVAVMLVCIPVFLTGRPMSRAEGIGFVLAYVVYLTVLLAVRT